MPKKLIFTLPLGASADDYLGALFEAGIDEPIGIGVEGVIAITVLYRDVDTVIEKVRTVLPNTKVTIES